ncbi:MAG TPA: M56 family metallopeptidase [Pyrinomonadaceae bacterium]|jgi:beta-lactamase regulating signal transducer with metallopeptidase domain
MNLQSILGHALVQNLGWTLAHSAWQLAAVAGLFAAANASLRRASPQARYCAACLALFAMLALPACTFLALNSSGASVSTGTRASAPGDARPAHADGAAGAASAPVKPHARAGEALDDGEGRATLRLWAEGRIASLLPWLALAWMCSVGVLLARLAGGWLLNRRIRREAGAAAQLHGCRVALARLAARLRVTRAVRVCRSALVEVPTVVGWLRPVILVPACALAGLSAAQLEAIIAHELAHVRRHDYLVNLLQSLVETLLFFHPAVWYVSRRARAEREHACDDLAVEATGDVLVYARALAELEQLRRPAPVSRLALAASGGSLVGRIQRLLKPQPRPPAERAPAAAALLAALALAFALAGAQGAVASRGAHAKDRARGAGQDARRRVAVTFVTLPMVHTPYVPRAEKDMRKLLAGLSANGVRAVGFVNAAQLYRDGVQDESRVNLLRMWLDAGMELGSEGFAHPNLYGTPLEDFERDVQRGEYVTSQLAAERGARLHYFSYPYLNVGPDRETKESFERFLSGRGMQVHKVTIDNWDWLFGKAYADARRAEDGEAMRRISDEYVPYMERVFDFYEGLSRDTLGYEPPQVLMLTANALNCEKFEELAAMLKRRGYSFVTLDEAMRDRAYRQPDTYTGAWGISWLQRWAMARGREFREEPPPPPYVKQFDTYAEQRQGVNAERK